MASQAEMSILIIMFIVVNSLISILSIIPRTCYVDKYNIER